MSVIRTFALVRRSCLPKLVSRDLSRVSVVAIWQKPRRNKLIGFCPTLAAESSDIARNSSLFKYYSNMPCQQVVSTEELLEEGKRGNSLIIDVREIDEINETGVIPGGIHIPLGTLGKAFQCSPEDFQRVYGVDKPNKDDKIILSCRSGKRSSTAYEKLQTIGYTNLWNYSGGWLAYEKHRNEKSH